MFECSLHPPRRTIPFKIWMGHKSTARIWGGTRHEDTDVTSDPVNTHCHEDSTHRIECCCDSIQACPWITGIVLEERKQGRSSDLSLGDQATSVCDFANRPNKCSLIPK